MKYSVYISTNDPCCTGRAFLCTFNDYLRAAELAQAIKRTADEADEPGNFTIHISASEEYVVAPAKEEEGANKTKDPNFSEEAKK